MKPSLIVEVRPAKGGGWYYRHLAPENGRVLLTSEVYTRKRDAMVEAQNHLARCLGMIMSRVYDKHGQLEPVKVRTVRVTQSADGTAIIVRADSRVSTARP